MAAKGDPTLSTGIDIDAPGEAVYALVTDLPTLAELAEETVAMHWKNGNSARPGAVFRGNNRSGNHTWTTTCTVTTASPAVGFAWDVTSGPVRIAHWSYDITERPGGCRVTESMWDNRPWWLSRFGHLLTGVADRNVANADHIRLTLERLKARAEA